MEIQKTVNAMAARVLAAFAGELDPDLLDDGEWRLFEALLSAYLSVPSPESEAFASRMREEGGYIGEDENGNLVRTLPGGEVELINDPALLRDSNGDIRPMENHGEPPVRSDLTIHGGEGYDLKQIDNLTAIMRADPELWFIDVRRKGRQLLIFRRPHL